MMFFEVTTDRGKVLINSDFVVQMTPVENGTIIRVSTHQREYTTTVRESIRELAIQRVKEMVAQFT